MPNLRFSGHESFHCRHFWLKKGFDYRRNQDAEKEPTVVLGVGKNMVSAISFWQKAFNIEEDQELAEFLFDDQKGKDPFLEDLGTLWLLQYQLVATKHASIYEHVFKDFRKKHLNGQFTVAQLHRSIERLHQMANESFSENTLATDIKVFLRNYVPSSGHKRDIEDDLASIFIDLNLIRKLEDGDYQVNVSERTEIPTEIFLYAILDAFPEKESISFDEIQMEVADAFACNKEGIERQIEQLQEKYPKQLVYKEDAGRKELQIKSGMMSKWKILEDYYG